MIDNSLRVTASNNYLMSSAAGAAMEGRISGQAKASTIGSTPAVQNAVIDALGINPQLRLSINPRRTSRRRASCRAGRGGRSRM